MFIETRHLRSLQTIAQSRSLAHAAEQLYITQSALSHQIKTHAHTQIHLNVWPLFAVGVQCAD